ncbi:uncharacterized protein LOC131663555 isoform X1 [Phymastichus coffea]|uniref:uncharacterized protein LOC131663555 isoform X1 n=1 Tax=Phymastichus coffea TaxID=108790 RepID=UPI00273C65B6|nr:uncharacterized protein LOC131663555 isoform X1 [Phymastichus coffea]
MATNYLSQAIIFQTLNNFFEDVKNMEDICNGDGDNFNDEKCECVFNYLEGLDHPQFQFYFQKLQLPGIHKSKKDEITEQSDPKIYLIDPKAYVIACGNNAPERKMANKEVCDELDKLIITDLYTKWWYDPAASCFNSILNTTKRSHPGAVLAFSLVLLGIVLTPIRLLQNL